MTKNEKKRIQEITKQWFKNCVYYEKEGMIKALKYEIGRLAALIHLSYEFGIKIEIPEKDLMHFIMYQEEKENWVK